MDTHTPSLEVPATGGGRSGKESAAMEMEREEWKAWERMLERMTRAVFEVCPWAETWERELEEEKAKRPELWEEDETDGPENAAGRGESRLAALLAKV